MATELYVRPLDKVERYLEKQMKSQTGCECTESAGLRSRYYTINGRVLRVSDHVGTSSNAHVTIIVPSFRSNDQQYVIHAHNTGQISVLTYDKVKDLVRSFFYLSSIFGEVTSTKEIETDKKEENNVIKVVEKFKELEKFKNKANSKEKLIMGIPVTEFTEAQLKPIVGVVNKVRKQLENKS